MAAGGAMSRTDVLSEHEDHAHQQPGPGVLVTRRLRSWLPSVLVPVLIAGGSFTIGAQARAVDLPDRSASEVLELIAAAEASAFSGTVEITPELGLPQLPVAPGSRTDADGAWAVLDLLTRPQTVRAYVDGPTRLRLQLLEPLAQRDLVRNGPDVWFYDSAENVATHLTGSGSGWRPEAGSPADLADGLPIEIPWPASTPEDLAEALLSRVDSTTQVTVDEPVRVAGRPAYTLVVTPRQPDTLVESVTIAADAETGMVTRVTVRAVDQAAAAYDIGFTSLDVRAPDAARFTFTPPPGATVEELGPDPAPSVVDPLSSDDPEAGAGAGADRIPSPDVLPAVLGTGWETIVVIPADDEVTALFADPVLSQALSDVPGGRLLSSSLFNVLVTDDGRVLVGSVTPGRLLAAAGAP